MNPIKILAIVLAEEQHVTIPVWAAIASLAGGVVLLATMRKP